MILDETINKFVRDIVNLLLSSPNYTIRAKQKDAPRPQGSYGEVDLISNIGIGWEQFQYSNRVSDDNLDVYSKGMREIMISIGFYRDNSIDNARLVHQGLVRESLRSIYNSAGLGLIRRSEVRSISEALENGWEERAQFDIFLSASGSDDDIVSSVGSINIEGEFQSRASSYNFKVEV